MQFNDTNLDIIDRNGQQWMPGVQIATALGYKRADAVAKIYDRNADEFTDKMTTIIETPNMGLSVKQRIFSLRGAHLIGMFARTKSAKAFRTWVLDVIDSQAVDEQPAITATITPEQKLAIRDAIAAKVYDSYPDGSRQRGFSALYKEFYHAFGISKYDELPASQYNEAITYLQGAVIAPKAIAPEPVKHLSLEASLKAINDPNSMPVGTDALAEFAIATIQRLQHRCNYYQSRINQHIH